MIVDPDFMDHWRTGMVADAIQDPMAPIYILRLWAHCQERKADRFCMPTRGLKAQCKAPCDADVFERALIDAGFIERDGETVIVLGWAEKNASLIAAWENGNKGGRPPRKKGEKEPNQNPAETHGLPSGNPAVTQTEPNQNPDQTHAEPIREEKIREEKKEIPPLPPKGVKAPAIALTTWIDQVKARGERAIEPDDPVFAYAEEVGIPDEFLRLAWREFVHRYSQPDAKRYRDWRSVFRKAVRGGWMRLWYCDPQGNYSLTTVGIQAQRIHSKEAA